MPLRSLETVKFGFEFWERQRFVAVSYTDEKRVKVRWQAFQYHCDDQRIVCYLSGISQGC